MTCIVISDRLRIACVMVNQMYNVTFVKRFFLYCVKEHIATCKEVSNTTRCLQTWLLDSDEL